MDAILAELATRFGRVPNFYATMARRPSALAAFVPLYRTIMTDGTLEPRLKELVYVKVSTINGCEYCTRAHSASARRAGVGDEQLRALPFYERSQAFDAREKAALLYAERVTRGAAGIRARALEEVRAHFDADQLVELALVVCMANFTNRFNDGLQLPPDIG